MMKNVTIDNHQFLFILGSSLMILDNNICIFHMSTSVSNTGVELL